MWQPYVCSLIQQRIVGRRTRDSPASNSGRSRLERAVGAAGTTRCRLAFTIERSSLHFLDVQQLPALVEVGFAPKARMPSRVAISLTGMRFVRWTSMAR